MSGKNEIKVLEFLKDIGYVQGVDFVRQHPIGEAFVLDFAFIKEQVALEVDGEDHKEKKQKLKDKSRDTYLHENNWVCIRVNEKDFFDTYKKSFYKSLIKDIVGERREQWEVGTFINIDIPDFKDEDYD